MPKVIIRIDPLITGVYLIRNKVNGKVYVGSTSTSFETRWSEHLRSLRRGKHRNIHIQRAFSKYGENAFEFSIVERCQPSACVPREQYWIDCYDAVNRNRGYNISPTAGSTLGVRCSEERKEKLRNQIQTPEKRMRCSIASKKRVYQPMSDATKEKLRARALPPITDETRRKMSEQRRGRKISKESRAKISAANTGHAVTEETRAKLRLANLRRGQDVQERMNLGKRMAREKRMTERANIVTAVPVPPKCEAPASVGVW